MTITAVLLQVGCLLQKVEERHQERLLVQRIGVSGMTVLVSGLL